jgi:hypothetical protein
MKTLHKNFLVKVFGLFFTLWILSGCATTSYLPALSNAHSFKASDCDLVYSEHLPNNVAALAEQFNMVESLRRTLEKNPSLADKVLPSGGTVEALGKNSANIGLGLASVVSAFKDNLSIASIIGSTVMGGLSTLGDMRSEDKTQRRVDVCMPKTAENIVFIHGEDVLIITGKKEVSQMISEANQARKMKPEVKKETLTAPPAPTIPVNS